MSLKKFQNKKKNNSCILKLGVVLFLDSQDQFNQLALLSGQFQEDSIIINGDFIAFSDDIGAIQVQPISSVCEDKDDVFEFVKTHMGVPTDFDKWYRKNKG